MTEQSVIVRSPVMMRPGLLDPGRLRPDRDSAMKPSGVKKSRNWYQCRRCRYHGQFVFLAGGHYQVCPFRNCTCQACRYVSKDTERAGQRMREWRKTKKERQYPARPSQARVPAPGHPSVPSETAAPELIREPPPLYPQIPLQMATQAPPPMYGAGPPLAALAERHLAIQNLLAAQKAPTQPSSPVPSVLRPLPPPLALPTIVRPNSPNSTPMMMVTETEQRLRHLAAVADHHASNLARAAIQRPPSSHPAITRPPSSHPAMKRPASDGHYSTSSSPMDQPPVLVIADASPRPAKTPKIEPDTDSSSSTGMQAGRSASGSPGNACRLNVSSDRKHSEASETSASAQSHSPGESWNLSDPEAILSLVELAKELGLVVRLHPHGDAELELDAGQRLRLTDTGSTVRLIVETGGSAAASANAWPKSSGGWDQLAHFLRTLLKTLLQLRGLTPTMAPLY